MPTETLNRVEDLIQRIGYLDDEEDEAELQNILEEAHQDLTANVGRNFIEDLRVRKTSDDEITQDFDLKLTPVFEVDEILLSEHEIVDESNYTVDKQEGTVTFDQSFVDDELYTGKTLRFKYKPVRFKDIELWRAVAIAKNQEIVQLEDSESNAQYDNALTRAKRMENQVNRLAGPGSARDGHVRRGTK